VEPSKARRPKPADAGYGRRGVDDGIADRVAAEATRTPPIEQVIYSGRTLVGSIAEHGRGHVRAFDADGELIGFFPDRKQAIRAVELARSPHGDPPQ
jgi:hypothetical protein